MAGPKTPKSSESVDAPQGEVDAPIWRPSPALAEAIRRHSERPKPPDAGEPRLPEVGALRAPRVPHIDDPDERGRTRLRPAPVSAPAEAPADATAEAPADAPPPRVERAFATRRRARWGARSVSVGVFLLTVVVAMLVTLAYQALMWHR